jgi:hypothetical protein
MSIINTFPTTISNGQVEDATVVMTLFAWIQSQTNGNACPATTGSAVLKGNGAGGTLAATAGTDYSAGTQALATGILKSTTSTGALSIAVANTDYAPSASPVFTGTATIPAITGMTTPLSVAQGGTGSTTGAQQAGEVCYFAMSTAPAGFLKANGALVSRTTYAALFTAIGTTFGVGDGSTTFALPDMRGQFARAYTDGSSVDTGRTFGSTQTDALQGHTHILNVWTVLGANPGVAAGTNSTGGSASGGISGGITTDGTNGTPRVTTETRPTNVALLACIKT